MPRTILHLDLDAFFCAVEEQRDPSLQGQAFAVGGRPDQRGVVASCSYPARQFGVRSAMPMSQAVRLCPQLQIVPHHFKDYRRVSSEVMAHLHTLTPLVEQLSIDEAFLDISGLAGQATACRLQHQINTELGLPCSLGVASNKLVAKIANNIGKGRAKTGSPPNAIEVVLHGQESAYLAPLPIRELWGVGPKTAERLHQLGVQTIGDLAQRPEKELTRLFGKLGTDLAQRARGIDERSIITEHEAKSISKETTFVHDVHDAKILLQTLRKLSDSVGLALRNEGLSGTTVKIKLRWADFTTLTRQLTLEQPIDQDNEIYAYAAQLFEKTWTRGKSVRLIGVGISGLDTPKRQLGLWRDEQLEQKRQLQVILDSLRNRFGEDIIQRGTHLKD